jgi:uncharacterized protein YndB with AHSA1/START domain
MPITSVSKDPAALTMTVVADFPVPVQRLWDAYADPRQLELFWGPPTYPARFTRHDMYSGGRSEYVMTGPDGDESRGYWEFLAVDPTQSFEVRDGFANPDGSANSEMPSMRMVFRFTATADGCQVSTTTYFNSVADLDQLVSMGMEQGMREAMAQMDAVIADLATFAVGRACEAQILSHTQVRVSRVIRGTPDQVWAAHHEPELMQRWLLGPDGWTMPVCEVAVVVGEHYRYEWQSVDAAQRFGFTGTLLDSVAPHRAVTTEQMIGTDGPATTNEMTLTPVEGGTLLSIVITYPSAEVRDMVLATGMTGGMETSYARLEELVLHAA